MPNPITDDLSILLDILPPEIREPLNQQEDLQHLIEVVIDLGRPPEARFLRREIVLRAEESSESDIEYVVNRIGQFGEDNRAGIERTLHRISAIRNRKGRVIGLTVRVGRAVYGTIKIIDDLIQSGQSVLLMGRPGVGKTTMLRETARVLADDLRKRVVIVDTSNEIAGDGDIPHPAIGRARRMQVKSPERQHAVMIEAVENHMPEVVVIDEIGTELEAQAARTIAERGVQLVGTAHGNTLANLMQNPTLADLIGGIQAVTLGDEEARRRGTQKTVLERKSPPTFNVVVEIQERDQVAVHPNVSVTVDAILRGLHPETEIRSLGDDGQVRSQFIQLEAHPHHSCTGEEASESSMTDSPVLYLFGINRHRLEQAAQELGISLHITERLGDADILVTSRTYFRRRPQKVRDAENRDIPVYVMKSHTPAQFRQLLGIFTSQKWPSQPTESPMTTAMEEARIAVDQVHSGIEKVELSPQSAYIRRLQHMLVERNKLHSDSQGSGPERRVSIYKNETG